MGSPRCLEERPEGGSGHGLGEKVRPQRGQHSQLWMSGRMRQKVEEGGSVGRGGGREQFLHLVHDQCQRAVA